MSRAARREAIEHGNRDGLAYRRLRATGAPLGTVLWIHGLGESSLCFEGVMASRLLARLEQVAPDLPGYGETAWSSEPRTLPRHAQLLARWVADLEGPLVVIGHSMGGVIGQMLCEQQSSDRRLAGLLNVEGNLSIEDCVNSGKAARHDLESFVDHGYAELVREVEELGTDDAAHQTYARSLRRCDPRTFHHNAVELVELSTDESLATRLAALRTPVAYVAGRPGGAGERSLSLLRAAGLQAVEITPSGHWPFIDQPDGFLGAMTTFLRSISLLS